MAGAVVRCAAVAATTGGLAWVGKGAMILAGRPQPPLLLELGLPCFGLALLLLALEAGSRIATALGVVATGGGAVALALDLFDRWPDPAITTGGLALVVGLALLRPSDQPGRWGPRAIGLATVPVTAAGGLLALVDEALLEVSTVVLGLAWTWLGVRLWRAPAAAREPRTVRPGPRASA
jgi:hypothetical protein